jgi:hypothetical protein
MHMMNQASRPGEEYTCDWPNDGFDQSRAIAPMLMKKREEGEKHRSESFFRGRGRVFFAVFLFQKS